MLRAAFQTVATPAEDTQKSVAEKPRRKRAKPVFHVVESTPTPPVSWIEKLSPLQKSQYERQRNLLDAIIAFTTVASPAPAVQHAPAQPRVFAMTFGGGGKNGVRHVVLSPEA